LRSTEKIESVAIDRLIPYANNSRKHSDQQIAQIAGSIKEFGFNNPVLIDKDYGIIAGHGRVLAARKLDLKEVPCIRLEHLTETQKKAFIIADNKIALNADWDQELLTIELDALLADGFAMEILGFDAEEMKAITDEPNFDPGTEEDQGKLDQLDPKWIACPHCGKEFDARQV
jgi:ParB-like chromosome segregation protein Spo0J